MRFDECCTEAFRRFIVCWLLQTTKLQSFLGDKFAMTIGVNCSGCTHVFQMTLCVTHCISQIVCRQNRLPISDISSAGFAVLTCCELSKCCFRRCFFRRELGFERQTLCDSWYACKCVHQAI